MPSNELPLLHALSRFASALLLIISALPLPLAPAHAYLGPGSGLAGLGSLFALIGVLGFAVLGFLWYPVKRLWQRLRGRPEEPEKVEESPE